MFKMNNIFIGFVIGILFAAFLFIVIPGSVVQQYHEAIDKCEATLPRNQHCKIIAIPKE